MPTQNPRIQVTLDPTVNGHLDELAHAHSLSLSAMAAELIREALELREDRALSKLADKRFQTTETWLSHEEVWGK